MKKIFTTTDWIVTLAYAGLIGTILFMRPITSQSELENLSGNLFDFSAIFSALTAAFLLYRLGNAKMEIKTLLEKASSISNLLTDFRRICSVIKNQHQLWGENYNRIVNQYSNLYYSDLHNHEARKDEAKDQLLNAFFADDNGRIANSGNMLLLLALKELEGERARLQHDLLLYENYDRASIYNMYYVARLKDYNVVGAVSYWLSNQGYLQNLEEGLNQHRLERLHVLLNKFDSSMYVPGMSLNEKVGEIGAYLDNKALEEYFEIMGHLREMQKGKVVYYLLAFTAIILTFGSIVPLILTSVKNGMEVAGTSILLGSVYVVVVSLILFIHLLIKLVTVDTKVVNDGLFVDHWKIEG